MTKHTPAPAVPASAPRPHLRQDTPTSMMAAPGSNVETLHTPEQPDEAAYGPREWRNLRDGFLYAHCVFPHPAGKMHKGMIPRQGQQGQPNFHTGLFWEGNEEEWFSNFRKE